MKSVHKGHFFSIYTHIRHKKRKASTGEPADAKIRAKKVTALPHPTHATGGSEEDDDTNANTKCVLFK